MREGKVTEEDMLVTFNCGIGMTLIVDPKDAEFVLKQIYANGVTKASVIGSLVDRVNKEDGVIVKNFSPKNSINKQIQEKSKGRKKIAVLISGFLEPTSRLSLMHPSNQLRLPWSFPMLKASRGSIEQREQASRRSSFLTRERRG